MVRLEVFDRDATSVCLWWASAGQQAAYAVQMRKQAKWGQEEEEFKTLSSTIKAHTVRKNNLESGRLYEWRVGVMNGDEVGEWSEVLVAGPTDPKETHQMEAPRIAEYDASTATVHWLPSTTMTGARAPAPYALQIWEDDRWKLASDRLGGDRVIKKNLRELHTYYFRIRPTEASDFEWSRASEALVMPRKWPALGEIFGPSLLGKNGKKLDTVDALAGKIVAAYFSASW